MSTKGILLGSALFFGVMFSTWWVVESSTAFPPSYAEAEAGFDEEPAINEAHGVPFSKWVRPEVPPRVGIQAGHYKSDEVPEELAGVRENGAGAKGGGTDERTVVFDIASRVVTMLSDRGIVAEMVPATVPPGYIADAFVSIHADASPAKSASGFKIAASRKDLSHRSEALGEMVHQEYLLATGLREDTNITDRMRGYYAFNWRKYKHAVHPMTPSVIVETGFITSPADQRILLRSHAKAAAGIAKGIEAFLQKEGLLENGI